MGEGKHVKLDNILEGMSDELAMINAATGRYNQYKSSALQYMEQKNVSFRRHSGIEVSYVPGAGPRLRVKSVPDAADDTTIEGGKTTSNAAAPESQDGGDDAGDTGEGEDSSVDSLMDAADSEQLH